MNMYESHNPMLDASSILATPDLRQSLPDHYAGLETDESVAPFAQIVGRVASGEFHLVTQAEREAQVHALVASAIKLQIHLEAEEARRLQSITAPSADLLLFDPWALNSRLGIPVVIHPADLALVDTSRAAQNS